jgi:hypothetical protein
MQEIDKVLKTALNLRSAACLPAIDKLIARLLERRKEHGPHKLPPRLHYMLNNLVKPPKWSGMKHRRIKPPI